MNPEMLTNFEVFAARLADDDLDVELKCTIASELCESLELLQSQDGPRFCSILWPTIREILVSGSPTFQSDSLDQKYRKTLLEVIHRISNNEILRPMPPDIGPSLLHVIRNDNEENAIVALKTLYDLHRISRGAVEGFPKAFLDLVVEIYEASETILKEIKSTADTSSSFILPSSNNATSASLALTPNSVPPSTSNSTNVSTPAYNDHEPISSQGNVLPLGTKSFKVLAEIPVIIVSVLQTNRKLAPVYVTKLLPLVISMLELEYTNYFDIGANNTPIQNYPTPSYFELIKAQSKTLSFLAFFVRSFGSLLMSYKDRIAKIFISLLDSCPMNSAETRKEILIAGRHLVGSDLKTAFLPLTLQLLQTDRLLGSGLTSIHTLRPYALSLVADYIYNVRQSLNKPQISKVVYFYVGFLKDLDLSSQIRALCAKLLFSITETISSIDDKLFTRHLLGVMISAYSHVFYEVSNNCNLHLCKNSNFVPLQNDFNTHINSFPQTKTNIEPQKHPSNLDRPNKRYDIPKTYTIKSSNSKHTATESTDIISESKFLLKSILPGCNAAIVGLSQSNSVTSQGFAGTSSSMVTWENSFMSYTEIATIRSILHHGFLSFAAFSSTYSDSKFQTTKPPPLSKANSATNPWGIFEVEFQKPEKEDKEIMEMFIKMFINLDPSLFQELFTNEIPHMFESLVNSPNAVPVIQLLLSIESTSPNMTSVLLSYLCKNFDALGQSTTVRANMMLHLFKISFLVLTMFPEVNEQVLQPFIGKMVKYTIDHALDSENPECYFLILRSLFRSIGGGRYESLYKEVTPYLHELLDMLNNMIRFNSDNSVFQELLVEISLTVPVRLSVLLPYLPLLMHPLKIAISSEPSLIGQGLRTLELCIDNLTRDFLDPILLPNINDILIPFWDLLNNYKVYPALAQTASRILGKLGGRNRNLLITPQTNFYSSTNTKNTSERQSVFFESSKFNNLFEEKAKYFLPSYDTQALTVPFLLRNLGTPVMFPVAQALDYSISCLENPLKYIQHYRFDKDIFNELSKTSTSASFRFIKAMLVYFVQNEIKEISSDGIRGLERWDSSVLDLKDKYNHCSQDHTTKNLFPLLSQPLLLAAQLSNFATNVPKTDADSPVYSNDIFSLKTSQNANAVNNNNMSLVSISNSSLLLKSALKKSIAGLFLSCVYELTPIDNEDQQMPNPIIFAESLIEWCAFRHIQDSLSILELLSSDISLKPERKGRLPIYLGYFESTIDGVSNEKAIYTSLFPVISDFLVSPISPLRKVAKKMLLHLHKSILSISESYSFLSTWLGCYYTILNQLCLYCYSSNSQVKIFACEAIEFIVTLLKDQLDWIEHFSNKLIKSLLFTLKDSDEKHTFAKKENPAQTTILQILSLCCERVDTRDTKPSSTDDFSIENEGIFERDEPFSKNLENSDKSFAKSSSSSRKFSEMEDIIEHLSTSKALYPELLPNKSKPAAKFFGQTGVLVDKQKFENINLSGTSDKDKDEVPRPKLKRRSSLLSLNILQDVKRDLDLSNHNRSNTLKPAIVNQNSNSSTSGLPIKTSENGNILLATTPLEPLNSSDKRTPDASKHGKNTNTNNGADSSSNVNSNSNLQNTNIQGSSSSNIMNLLPIFAKELSNPNYLVRTVSRSALELISNKVDKSTSVLLSPLKERLLVPIFGKPLRALPHGMQIGNIDAVTYYLGMDPQFLVINDGFVRLLSEVLALADAEDQALVSHPTQLYNSQHILINLRYTCICMLTAAMQRPELMLDRYNVTRARIISVFFKSLYSKSKEVINAANLGLQKVLSIQQKLPKDLLQAGLRPILLNLSDYKRLTVASLEGLSRLLQLLTNYFKVEVGRKLLDHLQNWAKPSFLESISVKSVSELHEVKIMVAILDVFYLLPPTASILLDDLVIIVLTMESQLSRLLSSPFRGPFFIFMNQFPSESVALFLKKLLDAKYVDLFCHALRLPGSGPLRAELEKYVDDLLNVYTKPQSVYEIKILSKNDSLETINFQGLLSASPDSSSLLAGYLIKMNIAQILFALAPLSSVFLNTLRDQSPLILRVMLKNHELLKMSSAPGFKVEDHDTLVSVNESDLTDLNISPDAGLGTPGVVTDNKASIRGTKLPIVGSSIKKNDNDVSMNESFEGDELLANALLLDQIIPNTLMYLACLVSSCLGRLFVQNPIIACRYVSAVGTIQSLKNDNFISEKITNLVVSLPSFSEQLVVISTSLDVVNDKVSSNAGKVYLVNNVLSPLILYLTSVNNDQLADLSASTDKISPLRLFHARVWISAIVTSIDERSGFDNAVRISLLHLTHQLIEKSPESVGEFRKDVIKFGWALIRSEDSMVKHSAYVVVAAFVAAFETPAKIVLQVYISLLRSHEPECKNLVHHALDLLLPVLDKRLSKNDNHLSKKDTTGNQNKDRLSGSQNNTSLLDAPVWVKWTRHILQEQGLNIAHTSHIYQVIIKHPDIFYPYHTQFILPLTNIISRMCLSQNSTLESRTLALDIMEMLLKWDDSSRAAFSKLTQSQAIDSKPAIPESLPPDINFALPSNELGNKPPIVPEVKDSTISIATSSNSSHLSISNNPAHTVDIQPSGSVGAGPDLNEANIRAENTHDTNTVAESSKNAALELAPIISEPRREFIVGLLIRLLCIAHEFIIKSGLSQRSRDILANYITRTKWPSLHLRLSIFERSIQQVQTSHNSASLLHLLKTLVIVTSEMEPSWFDEYFYSLAPIFNKLLPNINLETESLLATLAQQLYVNATSSTYFADETSPQGSFVRDLHAYIQDSLTMPTRSRSTLFLLNSVSSYLSDQLVNYIPLLVKLFTKNCKDHLSKEGRELLNLNIEPGPSVHSSLTWDLSLELYSNEGSNTLLLSMYLLKSFYIDLGDQRRIFINSVANLIEKTHDVGVQYALLVLMNEWLFGKLEFTPSNKDKASLMVSMMSFELSLTNSKPSTTDSDNAKADQSYLVSSDKTKLNNQPTSRTLALTANVLGAMYLDLVSDIYSSAIFSRTELTMRLEQVFLIGAIHSNYEIRKKYTNILDQYLPQSATFRLNYFIESQNWQSISNKYWLKLVVDSLLNTVVRKKSINDLCTCFGIVNKRSPYSSNTKPSSANINVFWPNKAVKNSSIISSFTDCYHFKGCKYNPFINLKKHDLEGSEPSSTENIVKKFKPLHGSSKPLDPSNPIHSIENLKPTPKAPEDENKYNLPKLPQVRTVLKPALQLLSLEDIVTPLQSLVIEDDQFAQKVWVDLFSSLWSRLSTTERHDITQSLIKLLVKPYLHSQSTNHPNVIQSILEAICISTPTPQLPPQLLRHLGQTFNSWHTSAILLEASLANGVEDQGVIFDQANNLALGTFEALTELYSLLDEEHMYYGAWSRNCQYFETYKAISFIQARDWPSGQQMVEQAQTKARSGVLPFSEVEYTFWETEWLKCAKQLQTWDMLLELGSNEAQPELSLEAGWRIWDISVERKSILTLMDSTSLSFLQSPRIKFLQAYLLLLPESADTLKNQALPTLANNTLKSKFQTLVEEGTFLSLSQWYNLPQVGSLKHLELLHIFQLQVELLDAQSIYNSFPLTNSDNLESKSLELKNITQSWRERLPFTTDPINIWSDLITWRQHVFSSVNEVYMPIVPALLNKNTSSALSKAFETKNSPSASTAHDIAGNEVKKHGKNAPQKESGSDSKNILKKLSGLSNGMEASKSSQELFSQAQSSAKKMSNNSEKENATGAVSTSFAYRGYHEMAWIINRFATVSRKHGLVDVSIKQLNKIYTLPNIEIQEAFLKLCGQAKCYIKNTQSLQTGLDAIGNTNLMYFSVSQRAEFFMLKGMFLAKQNLLDEADYAFAAGIQVDLNSGSCWSAWGRFNDERFRKDRSNINFAVNATSCYMQAGGLIKGYKTRRFLARILWLLSHDNSSRSVATAFDSYKGEVPIWYWVYYVPQLLLKLESKSFSQARFLLSRIAKQYPQSLHYALGTARDEAMLNSRITGFKPSDSDFVNSETSHNANPNPTLDQDSIKNLGIDELISKLKTAHPLLALSVETMIDQIKQRLKPSLEEDIYKLISTLLCTAIQHLYSHALSNNFDPSLDDNFVNNCKFVLQRVPEGRIRGILIGYFGNINSGKTSLKQFINILLSCKQRFACLLDLMPSQTLLSRHSPYLLEYEHQKFEEVHVPGQYLQICESNEDFSKVERFLPIIEVSRKQFSVTRVISLRTIDGRIVHFSVQHMANRHGRREERILQMFRILSSFCAPGRSLIENLRMSFSVPTIVSLAPHVRLIKHDLSSFSLHDVYNSNSIPHQELYQLTSKSEPKEYDFITAPMLLDSLSDYNFVAPLVHVIRSLPNLIENLKSIEDASNTIFYDLCKNYIPKSLLSECLYQSSSSAMSFWLYRQNLSFQISTSSFMSYLVSASTKSSNDYIFSRNSAEVVLSNFLPSYNESYLIDSSDAVPFRMTPNIQNLITDIGLEGIVPSTLYRVASDLVTPELLLQDFLEPFIQDEVLAYAQLSSKHTTSITNDPVNNPNNTSNSLNNSTEPTKSQQSHTITYSSNNVITPEIIENNVKLIIVRASQLVPGNLSDLPLDSYPTATPTELLNQATLSTNLNKMGYCWFPWL